MEDQSKIEEKLKIENQFKAGADWFFWIAGLSLINSIVILSGNDWGFIIGLGITQIVDFLGSEFGLAGKIIAFCFDLITAGIFVGFGFLARKRYTWAFVIGMILYALDGLIFLLGPDLLSIGFHLLALFFIFNGLKANLKLREIEQQSTPPLTVNTPPPQMT